MAVFVCYARTDHAFAVRLAQNLKDRGVRVWLDQWDIPAEADWDRNIDNALRECGRLLIVLSPDSVSSLEVRSELRTALDLGKPILPVLYQPCEIPRQLRLVQFVDFTGHDADYEPALAQLLNACGATTPGQQTFRTIPRPKSKSPLRRFGPFSIRTKLVLAALLTLAAVLSWRGAGSIAETHRRMNSAALSPTGSYLAAATGQGRGPGTARVWEVTSGRQIHRFNTSEGPFWTVAWSPKGNMLALGDHDGKIHLYQAGTWTLAHQFEGPRSPTKFIAWSPDGSAVGTGDDTGTVWVWDAATGKNRFRVAYHTSNVAAGAWSPDGKQLATASWDNSIVVIDGHSGELRRRLLGHASFVNTVAWSPDGNWIASGSLEKPFLIVWDRSEQPRILEGHQKSVEQIAWSSDGTYLASAGKDDSIRFWSAGTFKSVGRFNLGGSYNSGQNLAWSKDGTQLAAGDNANVTILTPQGEVVRKLSGYAKESYSTIQVGGWSSDGKRLAAFRTRDGAKVWDPVTGTALGAFQVGFFDALTN